MLSTVSVSQEVCLHMLDIMAESRDPKGHQVAGKLCEAITIYIFPQEVV